MFKVKNLIRVAGVALAMVFNSCNNSPSSTDVQNPAGNDIYEKQEAAIVSEDYLSALEKMGLATDDMVETEENIIIDGDIIVRKDQLCLQLAKTAQRRWPTQMSVSNAESIRMQIHSSMNDWRSLIDSAANVWNVVKNSRVKITLVTSSPELVIYSDNVSSLPDDYRNLPSTTCGVGQYCGSNVGEIISINMDSPLLNTYAKQIRAIAHEIGHTIGLAHTNDNTKALIPMTPSVDNNSMMLNNCGATTMLSMYDRLAITVLYPAPTCLMRYFNASRGDHFYTRSITELGMGNGNYVYERIQALVYPSQESGTVPLYRFFSSKTFDHFYTRSYSEGSNAGYTYEGVVGYVNSSRVEGTVPLFRYWNSTIKDHFYTTSWSELGSGNGNYAYEGIACYVRPFPF